MIHSDIQQILNQLSEENATEYKLKAAQIAATGVLAAEILRHNEFQWEIQRAITEGFAVVAAAVVEAAVKRE